MTTIIKPLGMSEDEIDEIEKKTGKWKKNLKKDYIETFNIPKPSESEIDEFESIYGALPMEYRKFLLEFNGGVPVPNNIIVKDNELVINFFLPIKSPNNYPENLYRYCNNYAERIPRDMIPIASSGGGDLILTQLGCENNGSIYYWYHDLECDSNAFNYFENVDKIAASFNELLLALREIE